MESTTIAIVSILISLAVIYFIVFRPWQLRRGANGIIIVVLVLGLLLTACGSKEETTLTVPESARSGDLVDLKPCTYDAREVEYAADCGTLIVPENRRDPNSRLIALPMIRIRSTNANPAEPIFYLSGGPGESNLRFYGGRIAWFIEQHDIVLVGYRGVDGTVRLDCPEVNALIKNLPGDMLGKETLDSWADANTRCARRLQSEGVDIEGYTVLEVVDDLKDAQFALGYERVNLFSISYGTRLAMIYTWRYPGSIFRSAMVAVNPPGGMVYEADVIDRQIKYYADLCAETSACSARTGDLAASIKNVNDTMPERWLGLPINKGLIRAASFESLSDTSQAPMVFDVWLAAEQGDYSGMAMLTLAGPFMFSNATVWGDNTAKSATAGDYDFEIDFQGRFNPMDSIIGSPRSELAISMASWPANTIPEEYRQIQHSGIETMLVSGSIDFWTPAHLAEDVLLPTLSTGQHVVIGELGHAEMLWRQPEASSHLLNTFFNTGAGDDSLFTYQPWEFKVGFGFPLMAKVITGVIIFLAAGVITLLRFIIRRRKARQKFSR